VEDRDGCYGSLGGGRNATAQIICIESTPSRDEKITNQTKGSSNSAGEETG
jgi:hypothetical protein